MMIINELAQWAGLAFLAFLVLGLTRQLGLYMLPRSEQLASLGPDVGTRIDPTQLGDQDGVLVALAESDPSGRVAILVVDEGCETCVEIVAALEVNDERSLSTVGMVSRSHSAFADRVARALDGVLGDDAGERVGGLGIVATPFLLVLDRELSVVHREVVGGVAQALAALKVRDSSADRDHAHDLIPVSVHSPDAPAAEESLT
jgi:hypothetical protein